MDINQAAEKFGWEVDATSRPPDFSGDRQVFYLPVAAIRRPLQGVRTNSKFLFYGQIWYRLYKRRHIN
jgi:hypothetical protein